MTEESDPISQLIRESKMRLLSNRITCTERDQMERERTSDVSSAKIPGSPQNRGV
jgi:hypothetical protein